MCTYIMKDVLFIMNNNFINLYQLNKYSEQLEIIRNKKNSIRNNIIISSSKKKEMLEELKDNENEIKSHIMDGILITDDSLKDKIINIILNFLKPYGYSEESIRLNLSDVNFVATNVSLVDGKLFNTAGNIVYIDYRFVSFDKDGYFKCFKEDNIPFLEYALTHEIFHICSAFRKDKKNISVKDDGLSEGFTDMFALMATGRYDCKSKNYDFLVKICTLLTNIVGIKNGLDDYINNIDSWNNIKSLFYQVGLNDDDFVKFHIEMSEILDLTFNSNINTNLVSILKEKQRKLTEFMYTKILIPFLNHSQVNDLELITLFDNLFVDYESSISDGRNFSK